VVHTVAATALGVAVCYGAMYLQDISTVALLPPTSGIEAVAPGLRLAASMLLWTLGGQWYGDGVSVLSLGLALSVLAVI
ncbi:hypothetical protein ACQ7B2_03785, partial [Escherichia coli]